jgi:hypothetical protein
MYVALTGQHRLLVVGDFLATHCAVDQQQQQQQQQWWLFVKCDHTNTYLVSISLLSTTRRWLY